LKSLKEKNNLFKVNILVFLQIYTVHVVKLLRMYTCSYSVFYGVGEACSGILEQGTRNRVGTGLSYRPARLHRLAESIPWNRSGLLKSLKIPP